MDNEYRWPKQGVFSNKGVDLTADDLQGRLGMEVVLAPSDLENLIGSLLLDRPNKDCAYLRISSLDTNDNKLSILFAGYGHVPLSLDYMSGESLATDIVNNLKNQQLPCNLVCHPLGVYWFEPMV